MFIFFCTPPKRKTPVLTIRTICYPDLISVYHLLLISVTVIHEPTSRTAIPDTMKMHVAAIVFPPFDVFVFVFYLARMHATTCARPTTPTVPSKIAAAGVNIIFISSFRCGSFLLLKNFYKGCCQNTDAHCCNSDYCYHFYLLLF